MTAPGSHSLRARLLWLLGTAIALVAVMQATVAYRTARAEADDLFDYQMQQMALSLRTGLPVTVVPGGVINAEGEAQEGFVVQVWTVDGLQVFRSNQRAALPQRATLGFSSVSVSGSTWRIYAVASSSHVIEVAQDMAVRRAMAGALALRTIAPIALLAPVLMLLMWWAVSASFTPVERVRQQVAARRADDLTPVAEDGLPFEVQALIHELNLLFTRLKQAFEAQQHFVADAAHELRSPLTALRLQVQALGRAGDSEARDRAVVRLVAGIDRATHLVEQLLVLARHQAGTMQAVPPEPVALAELARLELADAAAAARDAQVDIGLVHGDDARVSGQREALRILVRNLIENAIKYAPRGGRVDVEVRREGEQAVLRVDDSGAGIAPADRPRVLDRFYRVAGAQAPGSGLGLAIVKAIADMHGATLALGQAPQLGGLRVELRFALAP
jgi:two-component system, OmpR family, sensor kinase